MIYSRTTSGRGGIGNSIFCVAFLLGVVLTAYGANEDEPLALGLGICFLSIIACCCFSMGGLVVYEAYQERKNNERQSLLFAQPSMPAVSVALEKAQSYQSSTLSSV